ncbi:MAG: hypothetical protein HYZ28_07315 [Myxococcales bacterium]|nr:hypothetical protein [Myxococcales bacterium]
MVSEEERAHFRSIAQGMEELNRDAVRRAAFSAPGKNIEEGLAWSEMVSALAADLSRPDEVSPASLWRERALRRPNTR